MSGVRVLLSSSYKTAVFTCMTRVEENNITNNEVSQLKQSFQ